MNFFGIGGLELIVVFLVALLVVGPVKLVEGARLARKYMTELRRQREDLTQMVEEAVDMEGIRERLDQDGILDDVRDLSAELNEIREDARNITTDAADFKSLARSVVRPTGYSRNTPSPPLAGSDTEQEPTISQTESPVETSESSSIETSSQRTEAAS